jgi:hypothetical protein
MPLTLHTISTPVPQLAPSAGTWSNVTSAADIAICTYLISISITSNDNESNVGELYGSQTALQRNIGKKRATLWLWHGPDSVPHATIVFHASDGNPASTSTVKSPRFWVCAGVDAYFVTLNNAYHLLKSAVKQFAVNNGVATTGIYLWMEPTKTPKATDLIYDIFQKATTEDCTDPNGFLETYPNKRWIPSLTSWQLKSF